MSYGWRTNQKPLFWGYSSYRDDNWHGNAEGSRYFFILHIGGYLRWSMYATPNRVLIASNRYGWRVILMYGRYSAGVVPSDNWLLNFVVELESTLGLLCLR